MLLVFVSGGLTSLARWLCRGREVRRGREHQRWRLIPACRKTTNYCGVVATTRGVSSTDSAHPVVRARRLAQGERMPKSRGRRSKQFNGRRDGRSSRRDAPTHGGLREYVTAMLQADEAEARGDALAALEAMERRPDGPDGRPFWRPWRIQRLMQIVVLKSTMPRWGSSRWVLAQAAQALPFGHCPDAMEALGRAVELRGGLDCLPGVDRDDAMCKVMDHDWAFRQLVLYDMGILEWFMSRSAAPGLLAGADRISEWPSAPMRGLQLQSVTSLKLTWRDVRTGQQYAVLNLGGAIGMQRGQHVLGRLMPIEGGWMLDSVPLRVPPWVAAEVAQDPTRWYDSLLGASRARDRRVSALGGHEFPLLSDVPTRTWVTRLLDRSDLEAITSTELAGAVMRTARQGVRDPAAVPPDVWACVAAAVLEVDVILALFRARTKRTTTPSRCLLRPCPNLLLPSVACSPTSTGMRPEALDAHASTTGSGVVHPHISRRTPRRRA